MSDKRALYEQVILDHNRSPRNFGALPDATNHAEGYNALCGDRFTVYVKMDGDVIADVKFQGAGCAISKSSASVMTSLIKGKTKKEAADLFKRFHNLVTAPHDEPFDDKALGKLSVFSGVRDYPVRVKCATLAWHTLLAALEGRSERVSTE